MADYDYKAGKQRLEEILDNDMEVVEQDKLPNDDDFTFTNGYYSWVSAIFVDMRDSTELCADEDKEKLAKVFRSFSSEIIEILRDDEKLREIGIRGDCVYAVYTSPLKTDIYECADKCFYVNTFMKMLNRLLKQHSLPEIKVGIVKQRVALYEQYADGNMSKEEFIRQRDAYRVQEDEKMEQIQRLRTEKNQAFQPVKRDTDHLQTVMSTVEEAGDVMYLSQNVVETFIDRIEVFNDEHVKIHFTFENVLADYAE